MDKVAEIDADELVAVLEGEASRWREHGAHSGTVDRQHLDLLAGATTMTTDPAFRRAVTRAATAVGLVIDAVDDPLAADYLHRERLLVTAALACAAARD